MGGAISGITSRTMARTMPRNMSHSDLKLALINAAAILTMATVILSFVAILGYWWQHTGTVNTWRMNLWALDLSGGGIKGFYRWSDVCDFTSHTFCPKIQASRAMVIMSMIF